MFEKFELTILDLAFLIEVYNELQEINADDAHDMLFQSTFLRLIQTDSDYVQQKGVKHWAIHIQEEWNNKK